MSLPSIYVVRVYRRSARDRRKIVGVVEAVSDGRRAAFGCVAQLCALLIEVAFHEPGKAGLAEVLHRSSRAGVQTARRRKKLGTKRWYG